MICSRLLLVSLKFQLVGIYISIFLKKNWIAEIWSFIGDFIEIWPLCSGVDPKSILCEFYKAGQCQKGFKCKFSHDLNVQRKGEKIDIYSDKRDKGYCLNTCNLLVLFVIILFVMHALMLFWCLFLLETMEDWDQETLEKVVESKNKEYQQNKPTDIVSVHSLILLLCNASVYSYLINSNFTMHVCICEE